jgi:hypothetical protein
MAVPSLNKATAKHAKCSNNGRYTANQRSGLADHNGDVSTTDDEFHAPLSTDGDMSKQK